MSKHQSPFSEEIFMQWEDVTFHNPPLSYAEQLPRLEELLNIIRADGRWLYPFPDSQMVSGSLIGVYVLEGRLEAAACLAECLESHADYKIDLSTSLLAAQGRIVAFRLGNFEKVSELTAFLSSGRIPKHLVFNLIGYITALYDPDRPLPSDALNLCIELAITAGQTSLAKHFQSAATRKHIDCLNCMAAEASYNIRHKTNP
jgi:hypothetical protein